MLGYPALGLALALAIALLVQGQLNTANAFLKLLSKAVVATILYSAVLFVFERDQLWSAVRIVSNLLNRNGQITDLSPPVK
jgi:hypothetical protein